MAGPTTVGMKDSVNTPFMNPRKNLMRAVLCTTVALVASASVGTIKAQTLAMQQLQGRSAPQPQSVEVAIGCKAILPTPNDARGYFTTWQGPCQDGYAHGEGVKRIWALGAPLSSSHGFFEHGHWVRMVEGYVVKMGMVLRQTISPISGLMEETRIAPTSAPPWASDIAGRQPASQAEWDIEVDRRLAAVAAFKLAQGEMESSACEDIETTDAETASNDPGQASGASDRSSRERKWATDCPRELLFGGEEKTSESR